MAATKKRKESLNEKCLIMMTYVLSSQNIRAEPATEDKPQNKSK